MKMASSDALVMFYMYRNFALISGSDWPRITVRLHCSTHLIVNSKESGVNGVISIFCTHSAETCR